MRFFNLALWNVYFCYNRLFKIINAFWKVGLNVGQISYHFLISESKYLALSWTHSLVSILLSHFPIIIIIIIIIIIMIMIIMIIMTVWGWREEQTGGGHSVDQTPVWQRGSPSIIQQHTCPSISVKIPFSISPVRTSFHRASHQQLFYFDSTSYRRSSKKMWWFK